MRDGFQFAYTDARGRFFTIVRSARCTTVSDPLTLFVFYKSDWFFTQDFNLVRPHFEDFWRTDFNTLPATIAFIRINSNIPIAGPILESIIGDHAYPTLED
jgi:hypothetical protein